MGGGGPARQAALLMIASMSGQPAGVQTYHTQQYKRRHREEEGIEQRGVIFTVLHRGVERQRHRLCAAWNRSRDHECCAKFTDGACKSECESGDNAPVG